MSRKQDFLEKLSVLIIEDNQGDFVLIEDYLIEKFKLISIKHCSDYASGIDYLSKAEEKISVILLDLNLPDLNGLELINSILAHNFQAPIIILTGYSDVSMAKSSLKSGIYDYLVKDEINPAILHKTIIYALNRSSYIHQIEEEKHNYENLFNFNPQPTWLLDAESLEILNANIAAQKIYGITLDDFLKMAFTQLHPKEERKIIMQTLISKEEEEFTKNHFTHFLSDGKEIKVDIYFRKIKNISGDRIIVQSNDISETLKHISTIEIQNEKLRNIAWTQSHGVRAPLSRILGMINMLEEQPDSFDEISFWLEQLKISTNEMDDIVKKIVDETNRFEQE
ncbi:response regulator [Cryomorpha ignava]|uniref:histidine kinase n=1 Tax=Cryomorpha ignava TaxID=101383 RepID=A0A7K3WKH5_9FLAO|nr:response regulator [Cryomorpha ignava]NEN22147.1 response regulator [Cryomorpha ignava]